MLQFVFDYRSPYAYLASTQLSSLGVPCDQVPIDVVAVMKAVNNQPSPMCPNKAKYSRLDATRWARIYDVPFAPNRALRKGMVEQKIDGSFTSFAAVAAQKLGVFPQFSESLFRAIWAGEDDLVSHDGRIAFLRSNGIDVDVWQRAEADDVREQLRQNDETSAARGVFGVPSFFVGEELFFGNDRLEMVRARLAAAPTHQVSA